MGTLDERHDENPQPATQHDDPFDPRLDLRIAEEIARQSRDELRRDFARRMRGHHAYTEVAAGKLTIPDGPQGDWHRAEYRAWQKFIPWQAALCARNAPAPRDDLERAARDVAVSAHEAAWHAFVLAGGAGVYNLPNSRQQGVVAAAESLRDGVQELLHALAERAAADGGSEHHSSEHQI